MAKFARELVYSLLARRFVSRTTRRLASGGVLRSGDQERSVPGVRLCYACEAIKPPPLLSPPPYPPPSPPRPAARDVKVKDHPSNSCPPRQSRNAEQMQIKRQ